MKPIEDRITMNIETKLYTRDAIETAVKNIFLKTSFTKIPNIVSDVSSELPMAINNALCLATAYNLKISRDRDVMIAVNGFWQLDRHGEIVGVDEDD